jgi:hypothetical protein
MYVKKDFRVAELMNGGTGTFKGLSGVGGWTRFANSAAKEGEA